MARYYAINGRVTVIFLGAQDRGLCAGPEPDEAVVSFIRIAYLEAQIAIHSCRLQQEWNLFHDRARYVIHPLLLH